MAATRVREIALPPDARMLSTLPRLDYVDAFLVETGSARDRTAEGWARAILEAAPDGMRRAMRWGWFALGLRLGPVGSERHVLGWEVRRSTPHFVLLAAASRLGLRAEVLLKRRPNGVLFATFVHQENAVARAVWARVAPGASAVREAPPLCRCGRVGCPAVTLERSVSEDWLSDEGVFPDRWLRRAVDEGWIHSKWTILPDLIQPASLDLRLGERAYRLQCSFLPGTMTVEERLQELVIGELDLRDEGAILEPRCPYLIPLMEELRLPDDVRGRANPKSSTGRLDVFTRVITDRGSTFDDVRAGYVGPLFLEVVPLSFTVRVQAGLSLNQLRLERGAARIGDGDIRRAARGESPAVPRRRSGRGRRAAASPGGPVSQPAARGDAGPVGYRAKRYSQLVDLSRPTTTRQRYWEEVGREHTVWSWSPATSTC